MNHIHDDNHIEIEDAEVRKQAKLMVILCTSSN